MLKYYFVLFLTWACVSGLDQCSSKQNDLGSSVIHSLNSKLHTAECKLTKNTQFLNYEPKQFDIFDYVIVGGGTAGSVVANRLSENNKWRILLLEAGGDPTVTTEIPGLMTASWKTELDWLFKTEREENIFLGLNNNTSIWSRGKVLGGSSVLNHMVYLRGCPRDYDNWEALGNPGWSYKDLLPLFKKIEDLQDPELLSDLNYTEYHGKNGYLTLNSYNYIDETGMIDNLKKSMKQLGYDYFPDANANRQNGFFRIQGTLKDKTRCSAAKAFLSTAQNRYNLKISKYSEVTKIVVLNNTAIGVQFLNKRGEITYVRVRKEVILSAGSINTPKILMLSGIGPKSHLDEMKIKTIKNLKVGENLQDHIILPVLMITHNVSKSPPKSLTDEMYEFLTKSTGSLSGVGSVSYTGFINTAISTEDYPDIQFFPLVYGLNETATIKSLVEHFGIKEKYSKIFTEVNSNSPCIILMPILLRPKSRGKILLRSSNPEVNSKILTGFLTENEDLEVLLKSIQFISNLTKTDTMKSINANLIEFPIEGCKGLSSDEYWMCIIRHFAISGYHQCGTCKMGPATDKDAVVDPRLRVYGVKNIRVADLSIVPQIVSKNTQATAYVIGEKAAEMIKEDTFNI